MSISLSVCLSVCLRLFVCRQRVVVGHWLTSERVLLLAATRSRHVQATRTMGGPDFFPCKKTTPPPGEIYARIAHKCTSPTPMSTVLQFKLVLPSSLMKRRPAIPSGPCSIGCTLLSALHKYKVVKVGTGDHFEGNCPLYVSH